MLTSRAVTSFRFLLLLPLILSIHQGSCGSRAFLTNLGQEYTIKQALSLLGISRALYYAALKNRDGRAAMERATLDASLIRQVMEYN